ncbi:MAG: glycoside hydrolase family 88 protein [Dietzia sp.]
MAGEDLANARLAEPPRPPVPVEAVTAPELVRTGDALARRTWEMGLHEWFWGEGVCLLGLARLARAQGRPYPGDVLAWLEERVRTGVTVEHVNHLAPGAALALAIGDRPDLADALHDLVAWLRTPGAATYDAEGTLEHWPGGIWADTVFMTGVTLGHIGLATGDHRLIVTFAEQVRRHHAVLQDEETGLFVHGSHHGQVIRCFWGRANAWCALAMVELLEVAEALGTEQVESLGLTETVSMTRADLARQLVALADLQPEHGVWSVLVDEHPETAGLVETSAAAGIGAAMLRAHRLLPDLPTTVHRAGWRAVRGVMAYVDPDGTLTRTSAGTVLQLVPFGYSVIRDDRIQPWGQGLALHAVAAALEALNSGEEPM